MTLQAAWNDSWQMRENVTVLPIMLRKPALAVRLWEERSALNRRNLPAGRRTQNGCCMYQSHFELHRPLFQGGDRSRHFFRSQSIREIQPRLVRTLRGSLGPSLLTARQGAGRTALLRQIRSELEHDGRAIVVSGAALDSAASF